MPYGPLAPGARPSSSEAGWLDQASVTLNGVQIGMLDLWYSPRCGAGWAGLLLDVDQPIMMGEVTVVSGDDRFSVISDPLDNETTDHTGVIVPGPGPDGCLGAGAALYEAGQLVMTAVIPCVVPAAAN